jgi:hypothetical protein
MSYLEIEQSRTARVAINNRSETHLPRSFTGSLLRRLLRDDFVSAPRNHLGAQQYLINQLESLAIQHTVAAHESTYSNPRTPYMYIPSTLILLTPDREIAIRIIEILLNLKVNVLRVN